MSKILKLYNTFGRSLNHVEVSGKLVTSPSITVQPIYGSLYICGPTVYSDSHVGHAITYIRADLFRRFMKSLFNVRLTTVMNITDIDDKILDKTATELGSLHNESVEPASHPFNQISEKYYKRFLNDLNNVRAQPADVFVRVSRHVDIIVDFIRRMEDCGHAYVSPTGDVNFRVRSVHNYIGRIDSRRQNFDNLGKENQCDFVLWKMAKPGEPVWNYTSANGTTIPGRPGWHVQCSAISSAFFGERLDFHFGGKDLIFPHHYNEEACCCAYHKLDTSKSLHVWANNWLHSGHLTIRDAKMSKSLGNVIKISDFISRSSVNALRLLCVRSHYRTDIEYTDELLERLKGLDHRINAFSSFLIQELRSLQDNSLSQRLYEEVSHDSDIELAIQATYDRIIDGVCDDFNLDSGLESLMDLAKMVYSKDPKAFRARDLIATWTLLNDWCSTCGLVYGDASSNSQYIDSLANISTNFRQTVRVWTLDEMKAKGSSPSLQRLLNECDIARKQLDELGCVTRDSKT